MGECETCLNSRPIISENGLHRVCCLSSKKAVDCITGKKKYYTRTPNKQQIEGQINEKIVKGNIQFVG